MRVLHINTVKLPLSLFSLGFIWISVLFSHHPSHLVHLLATVFCSFSYQISVCILTDTEGNTLSKTFMFFEHNVKKKKSFSFNLLLIKVCGRLHTWQWNMTLAAAVLQLDSASSQEMTGLAKHAGPTVITSACWRWWKMHCDRIDYKPKDAAGGQRSRLLNKKQREDKGGWGKHWSTKRKHCIFLPLSQF